MDLKWTSKALSDLVRLYDFLAPVNKPAAARVVQSLTAAPARLKGYPRIGDKLEEFEPREVRRILVNHYEIRIGRLCRGSVGLRQFRRGRHRRAANADEVNSSDF